VGKIKQKLGQTKQWLAKKRRAYMAARPHRSFKPTKTPRKRPPIVRIKKNIADTFTTIWQEKRLLFGLGLIYVVATYILVGGVAQADFVALKDATLQVFGGTFSSAGTALSLLTSTMSGAFASSLTELQQFLAVFLGIMFWLTIVWALRMRFADQKIKVRDALYSAGAPVVAYALVGLAIILQLTPGALGIFIFSTAQNGGWIQGGVEVMMFAFGAFLLCCLSIYWLAGSLLALVVVTLPQMYPWRALSISSELVIGRRLRMVGHAGALVAVLFGVWVVVLLPVLLLDGWLRIDWIPLIPIAVQLLGAFTLIYFSTYVYRLYRSLI
jgi:hypothetical protein